MNANSILSTDQSTPPVPAPPVATAKTISPVELSSRIQSGKAFQILDVRTPAEYEAAHIEASALRPLDVLDASEWRPSAGTVPVYVLCQAGGRATRAASHLVGAGVPCTVIEGGLDAWSAAGLPVVRGESKVLPLMRQVQIVIGVVSATGSALAIWKNPWFALLPLAMGAGLIFAGVSGTCGLALLMARMPWNRGSQKSGTSVGTSAPAVSCCSSSNSR